MKTALITGANRGLGLETARQLEQHGYRVVLGVRDRAAGEAALKELGKNATLVSLDLADRASIEAARGVVGELDVLVNNAAVALNGFGAGVAKSTIAVNYFGTAAVSDIFIPLIRRPGAVVMVSSGMGELSGLSPELQKRFLAPALDRPELDALMNEFVDAVAGKKHTQEGWPGNAYSVSKCGVNALVRLLAREHAGLAINAVCPGWVRTRMGGRGADRDVREGADSIVWAAMFAGEPSGHWYRDRSEVEW
jgi:NAD(P)-dependent dehydrogenase (short-subunit alcohol dehydrogenase family)